MTFTALGKGGLPSSDFKKIWAHFVHEVKHDGKHKAIYVEDGHKTDIYLEIVHSIVVPLRAQE